MSTIAVLHSGQMTEDEYDRERAKLRGGTDRGSKS